MTEWSAIRLILCSSKDQILTKWHLDLIGDTLNTHECERDNRYDGYSAPPKVTDKRKRKGEEVEADTLFEMDTVCKMFISVGSTL